MKKKEKKSVAVIDPKPPSRWSFTLSRRTWIVFAIALGVRLLYLIESSDSPFYSVLISDAATYHELAVKLMAGEVGWRFFFQGVFYPFFLFVVYSIFGPSVVAVKVIQAIVGAVTAMLTERLGTTLGDHRTGWIAGLVTALYGPLIFFDGELLATTFGTFFAVVLISGFVAMSKKTTLPRAVLLGGVAGISVLTRPVFLPFVLVSTIWVVITTKKSDAKAAWRGAAGIVIGFFLGVLPAAMANKRVTNHFDILPSSGGLNLYIGNNAHLCETLTIRPGEKWAALVNEPIAHGYVYGADKETYFTHKFMTYVWENPGSFSKGIAQKALRFVNGREIPRNTDIYLQHKWSTLMRIGVWKLGRFGFPFSVLLMLASLGLIFGDRTRLAFPFYAFLVIYPLSVIAVFVAGRYRLPVIPVMSVLAGSGLTALYRTAVDRRYRRLLKMGVVMMVCCLLAVAPPPFCEETIDMEAELYTMGGMFLAKQRENERAVSYFEKATEVNPRYAGAFQVLGIFLSDKGQLEASEKALRTAVRLDPDAVQPLKYLGKTLLQLGRLEEAKRYLGDALEKNPKDAYAHSYLGICLAKQGKLDEAEQHLKTAVRLMPGDTVARENLRALLRRRAQNRTTP